MNPLFACLLCPLIHRPVPIHLALLPRRDPSVALETTPSALFFDCYLSSWDGYSHPSLPTFHNSAPPSWFFKTRRLLPRRRAGTLRRITTLPRVLPSRVAGRPGLAVQTPKSGPGSRPFWAGQPRPTPTRMTAAAPFSTNSSPTRRAALSNTGLAAGKRYFAPRPSSHQSKRNALRPLMGVELYEC